MEARTLKEFKEKWSALPEPRQCFIDNNEVATLWTGDQNRFGDMPGRQFGPEHCQRNLLRKRLRQVRDALNKCKSAQRIEQIAARLYR